MIRRKFMKYAPKEHNEEKVKANLIKHNVPVFEGKDPLKFGQYGTVAKDLNGKIRRTKATPDGGQVASAEKTFAWQQKALYGGGTGSSSGHDPRNPYAVAQPQGNPYAQPIAESNPYESGSGYAGAGANPYVTPPESQPVRTAPKEDKFTDVAERDALFGSFGTAQSASSAVQSENEYIYGQSPDPQQLPPLHQSARQATRQAATRIRNAPKDLERHIHGEEESLYPDNNVYSDRHVPQESTANIRSELFGAAPQRLNPEADEFDELNRTTTEIEREENVQGGMLDRPQYQYDELDELGVSEMDRQPRFSEDPFEQAARNAVINPSSSASVHLGEPIAPPDELNDLPSQYEPIRSAEQTAYSSQQLFEDSEDEDVEYTKREIRQTKQESVESTRRALEIAREAELSGVNALGMLGNQGERLGGAAKTVALGNVQARVGDRNADELIRLNRSIFIPNISNPFNSRRRNQLKEQRLKGERALDELESQQLEMQQREADRRIAEGLTAAGPSYSDMVMRRQRLQRDNPERKMYQFEADSDDEALEDELGDNLEEIANATSRLHNLSLKIQEEVDDQNHRIDQMGGRVDALDLSLLKSTAKMTSIT